MKYTVVDSAEFTYPDIIEYPSSSDAVLLDTARKGYATFQILLSGLSADRRVENWLPERIYKDPEVQKQASVGFFRVGNVRIRTDLAFDVEWYSLVPVTVERNHGIEPDNMKPHFPERKAPYRVYDCMRPFDGTLDVGVGDGREEEMDIGGIYGAAYIPEDALPGEYKAEIEISVGDESVSIPIEINVYAAVIPEETLTIIQGHSEWTLASYHNLQHGSEEFYKVDEQYVKLLRRMRQNMMYVGGVRVKEIEKNRYEFDFSDMENTMRRRLSQGIKRFNGPSVGWRKSWSGSTILLNGSIPAMSYEGYCYLSQYLPALHEMLEKNGWLDRFVMGVADEPNEHNATEFRALCGLVRKIVPDIRLIDAMSYGDIHGALDIWVPLNAEYDKHRAEIETLRAGGDEVWHYVCCVPRKEEYINRFIDYPLLSTRYLLWGNYKYDLTGYLHWATASYQPGQDPFRLNCPEHTNTDSVCYLPAGDTHLLYPGESGPWLSVRAEAQREGAEEYEMLKKLAKKDKEKADAICDKLFGSFCDVEYDVSLFRKVRRELLLSLSTLS